MEANNPAAADTAPRDIVQAPAPRPSGATPRSMQRWQLKLLPFMVIGLLLLGAVFFIATLRNYDALTARATAPQPRMAEQLAQWQREGLSPQAMDFRARALLEERLLDYRYGANAAALQARVWTRFMAFLAGVVMVMAGCLFVLGKLDTDLAASGKGAGGEATLKTNSPGLVLALLGTLLMYVAITVSGTNDQADQAVYLPDNGSASDPDLDPVATAAAPPPSRKFEKVPVPAQ